MRFIGGRYLLFLGLKELRSVLRPSGNGSAAGAAAIRPTAAYRKGFVVVMTDPKAALMWVAVTMFLASTGISTVQFVLISLAASASAMTVYGTYPLLFSTGIAVRVYRRLYRAVESVFGVMLGVAGGKLVLDGVRDLRS